jgi:TRAP-type C4-dicarboxylate transport system permease small subunit
MLARLKHVAEAISEVLCAGGAIAVGAMVVLVSYSSISRYVFNYAISFMDEVAGLLLMVVCFCSFAYVFMKGGHIRVALILDSLPVKAKTYLELLTRLILLFYLIIFTKISFDFVIVSYELDNHTADSGLYEVPWMAVMPVSGFIFGSIVLISCLEPIWALLTGKKSEIQMEFEKKGAVIEEETKSF